MVRQPPREKKVKIGVSLAPEHYDWIAARAGPGKEFSSVTHALERGIVLLRERETRETAPPEATLHPSGGNGSGHSPPSYVAGRSSGPKAF